jgi:NAD(P)-dependent dehydrogenase (short-subunit alcohol dehydrogenase family)
MNSMTPPTPLNSKNNTTLKTVLVTGAAHRLGAELVRSFAQAGWQVFLHYAKSQDAGQALAKSLTQAGGRVTCVQADLADADQRQALMNEVYSAVSRLDCLVNNASLFEPDAADGFSEAQAQAQWTVNMLAPMDLTQMMAQKNAVPNAVSDAASAERHEPASVIHILDQKVFNLNPDYFSYTLSKLALERAVALQAQALAPQMRVCGVAPGLLYLSGPQTQENFDLSATKNLMGRPIDPRDVASTCLFLASNSGITGVTFAVDNGQHLVASPRDVMFVAQAQLESRKI